MNAVTLKQDEFELAVDLQAPMYARCRVRHAARSWGLPELEEDAALLVTEIATNAIRASDGRPGASVKVWIVADRDSLVLAVHDSGNDGLPVPRAAGPDDLSGRGLIIVNALAASWGAYATVPTGTVVWCQIRR